MSKLAGVLLSFVMSLLCVNQARAAESCDKIAKVVLVKIISAENPTIAEKTVPELVKVVTAQKDVDPILNYRYQVALDICEKDNLEQTLSKSQFREVCPKSKSKYHTDCFKQVLKNTNIRTARGLAEWSMLASKMARRDINIDEHFALAALIDSVLEVGFHFNISGHAFDDSFPDEFGSVKQDEVTALNVWKNQMLPFVENQLAVFKKEANKEPSVMSLEKRDWMDKTYEILSRKLYRAKKKKFSISQFSANL